MGCRGASDGEIPNVREGGLVELVSVWKYAEVLLSEVVGRGGGLREVKTGMCVGFA